MKKDLIFLFAAFFFMSLTTITGVYAIEEDTKVLFKGSEELTGDGKVDSVYLNGLPYGSNKSFMKNVEVTIAASNGKEYSYSLGKGIDPRVKFTDLDHNGIKDIITTVQTGKSGNESILHAYTLKDYILTDLSVPKPLNFSTELISNYKAAVKINETGKKYIFDLTDRKQTYNDLGIYHNGKPTIKASLITGPFLTLKPEEFKGGKMGLLGTQRISGVSFTDTICTVESSWYLTNGEWKLDSVAVSEVKGH